MLHDPIRRSQGVLPAIALMTTLMALALSPSQAPAEQFIALDEDYTHSSWYYHFEFPSQPDDWTTPANYSRGTAHFRVEVRNIRLPIYSWDESSPQGTPPDDIAEFWCPQVCLFQDEHIPEKHACFGATSIMFNHIGLYHATKSMSGLYGYDVIDWTRPLMNPMVIAKTFEPYGRAYSNQRVDMRITVIIVASGDTFEPPAWWYTASSVPGDPLDPEERSTWGALKTMYR